MSGTKSSLGLKRRNSSGDWCVKRRGVTAIWSLSGMTTFSVMWPTHSSSTLMAGFTTVRDLGTEGAAYADVELKQAVNQGIVPGPRILASTRAIVATGSY